MLLQDINGAVLAQAADRICAGMMDATKNRNVMAPAAAILHCAAKNDLCEYKRIDKFKEKLPDPRAVDVAVAELLVNSATGPMKLLLTWLFTVGTRISETLGVQRENINREARTFKMKMAKPERWETVPLPDAVLRLLPEDLGTGPLFPWKNRERVRLELKPLRDKLGLTFTPHHGRHTFATEIVNSGETLDHLPHWKDPKSRARYGRASVERQRQVMGRAGVRWGRAQKPR
jgi:integrase